MSFYGKKFKKTKFENVDEFMEILEVPEKLRLLIKSLDTLASFKKNDDGTINYTVNKGDTPVFSQNLKPGQETDFTTPDGKTSKMLCILKDNAIETIEKHSDGKHVHMERVFEGNTMKHITWKEGIDMKAIIYCEAV